MSSKKKDLDNELSDVSSEEENIVKFAKKKGDKLKINTKEKILSKKTKRDVKEESDSESESSDNKKNKKLKKEEKKEKKKKEAKKSAHNSDDDEDMNEEVEKVKDNKNNKNKKKKEEKSESDEEENNDKKIINEEDEKEESDQKEEEEKNNKKKNKTKKEESDDEDDSSSEKEDEVKPKSKNKIKQKEEKSESDSDKSEKEPKEEQEENSEPKLVKNPNKENEDSEQKEKEQEKVDKKSKSYNSGTWPELFVNNLSYKTTDESLKKYFSKYGEVESTKIVFDKETGRPKGVGFCKFCDSSSAAKALKDNDNLFLDGRPIAVSYSNDKKGSAKVRKSQFQGNKNYEGEKFSIFIGNLSFKTNEDGIKNLFEDCGNIIDIRIARRPDGNPRGFAHVDFDSKEGMEMALEKTGYRLDGRELRIDKTTNQPSANKKNFGENSYYKNKKKKNEDNNENDNEEKDLAKAKKTGKIINTGSKSQKIEDSDDSDDE